mmetsp:Transcript_138978/g.240242  ORF Transcript_138978/g.240242 Transcript_138978/m.240242 type:complete len:97 (+) Transcript_138978:263-553(+)
MPDPTPPARRHGSAACVSLGSLMQDLVSNLRGAKYESNCVAPLVLDCLALRVSGISNLGSVQSGFHSEATGHANTKRRELKHIEGIFQRSLQPLPD